MAHKLKITLEYTDPKIYRTVIVPEDFTFHQLHVVIQNVMNWEDYHLYQFNIGAYYTSDSISLPDIDEEDFFGSRYQKYDATKTDLSDFFNGQNKKINYVYDFGDDWRHTITPYKKPSEEVLFPRCIAGEHPAPLEDCGGSSGFYELLEIIAKKRKNSEEREMLESYGIPKGKNYDDIYGFDIDDVNQTLQEIFEN